MKAIGSPSSAGRIKLLDSAEALFAQKGYDGASLREITRLAGVELGLATYHFRNKDELYRQVLLRRAADMAGALDQALDAALARDLEFQASVRAILHAYVEPHVERLHGEIGWRHYIRLAALTALFLGRPELSVGTIDIYQPVMERFRSTIGALFPNVDPLALDRHFYVFQMAILSISIDGISPSIGTDSSGKTLVQDELIEAIVDIYTAGFIALKA